MSRAGDAVDARDVRIRIPGGALDGTLEVPADAAGVVVFAHGAGSGRTSPRGTAVAARLREAGFGTLLMDLLTPVEADADRRAGTFRGDAALLGTRVVAALDWLAAQPATAGRPLAVLGASTGAGAALLAAAARPALVAAVVCRGGRTDLAEPVRGEVRAPVLLVVGGEDRPVADLNRTAAAMLAGPSQVEVIPGARHLFGEPGALEAFGDLAAGWLSRHLGT